MPTVMVTFVKATYVLATFVHIRNISAVTDPILTKLFGPNFWGPFFGPRNLLYPKLLSNFSLKSLRLEVDFVLPLSQQQQEQQEQEQEEPPTKYLSCY